jgi:hypothetical protein
MLPLFTQHRITMTTPSATTRFLDEIVSSLIPWQVHEENSQSLLQISETYLGGDGLRPYIVFEEEDALHFSGRIRPDLPLPPFMQRLLPDDHRDKESGATAYHIQGCVADVDGRLRHRYLRVPNVHLVHLADCRRYQTLRLPLGIARLAQWLRFTNVARVSITDYTTEEAPLRRVATALTHKNIDVIGVSVNFGQRDLCEDVATCLKNIEYRGIVVLGNILAAKSPQVFADMFYPIPIRVATSLGEIPLAALCENIIQGLANHAVDGLIEPRRRPSLIVQSKGSRKPEFVFPDDGVTASILFARGQLSLETSIGCNYGKCTFCPRDHRGDGWSRVSVSSVASALRRIASVSRQWTPIVSFVDEEFFGAEGLNEEQSASTARVLLETCRAEGIRCEIYTRAEQLFSRAQSLAWNLERAALFSAYRTCIERVFVGVESGSASQLKRYGKGQTPESVVDALRIGSLLGVPMEFGFITFDPLLSPTEFVENLNFLKRRDVLLPHTADVDEISGVVSTYFSHGRATEFQHAPLFSRVAYLATELEVLIGSSYARMLTQNHPSLLTGVTDANFARLRVKYADPGIGSIADVCRCWTEGMFLAVYRERMKLRTEGLREGGTSQRFLSSYRAATIELLELLSSAYLGTPPPSQAAGPVTADVLTEELPLTCWLPTLEILGSRCVCVAGGNVSDSEIGFQARALTDRRAS